MLQRIVGVGVIYMVLSSVESWMKLVQPKNDNSRNIYAASLLLALMDAGISFWIFSSLVQTTRTLRLRRFDKSIMIQSMLLIFRFSEMLLNWPSTNILPIPSFSLWLLH